MDLEHLIKLYLDLFAGRPDVYAIRLEGGRALYVPSDYYDEDPEKAKLVAKVKRIATQIGSAQYGAEAVESHLFGEQFLGIYPIWADSTVRLFVLDFDGDTAQTAWDEVVDHWRIFREEAGLPVYIERSRGGDGFHLWGFLDAPVNAGVVRHALHPYIAKTGIFDRMMPNQQGVNEGRPLGNLIALPLSGPLVEKKKNCFFDVDEHGQPVEIEDQKDFLSRVEKIPATKIQELFDNAPTPYIEEEIHVRSEDNEGLKGGYKVVDSRFGCEWINWCYENPEEVLEPEWHALACQFAQLEGGRYLFHKWSAQDPNRYSSKYTDKKFDHALKENKPHTCDYIRHNLNGPPCTCDKRYAYLRESGIFVTHPYDLAKVPLYELSQNIPDEKRISTPSEDIDAVLEWMKEVHKDPVKGMGLAYGHPPLDEVSGLMPSTFNALAARPGTGKTAFLLTVAESVAVDRKIPVVIFSLEMSRKQLYTRLMCQMAGVSATRMRKGQLSFKEWRRLHKIKERLTNNFHPLFIDDVTRDIRQMFDVAGNVFAQHGKGVIMIDYLQICEWYPGETEYPAVSRISRESKMLAKALDCPVFAALQMNRSGDGAKDDDDTLDSWLRGSGQIEQDLDTLIYLLGDKGPGIRRRTFVFHKQRELESGIRVPMEFNQETLSFGAVGTWHRAPTASAPSVQPILSINEVLKELNIAKQT